MARQAPPPCTPYSNTPIYASISWSPPPNSEKPVPQLVWRRMNGLAALNLIGPSASQYLVRAGAVLQRGRRFMLAQREGWNSIIDETRDDDGWTLKGSVHRAAFLRELRIWNSDRASVQMHISSWLAKYDLLQFKNIDIDVQNRWGFYTSLHR